MIEKLGLPFSLLSDARGELAKLYGLWNADEGVAVPTIIVVDRSGTIRYLYTGHDFADRPGDEEVFEALDEAAGEAAGEAADGNNVEVRLTAEEARDETVRPDRPPMPFEALLPYYRGTYFTTVALKRRFGEQGDREAFREVDRYQQMVKKYQTGIQETAG